MLKRGELKLIAAGTDIRPKKLPFSPKTGPSGRIAGEKELISETPGGETWGIPISQVSILQRVFPEMKKSPTGGGE